MKRLGLVLAFAACGGGPKGETVGNTTPVDDVPTFPAAVDNGLFVDGASWSFTMTPEATATCTAAERRELAGGVAVRIHCTGALDAEASGMLAGWWAATADGIYTLDLEPTAGAPLDPEHAALFLASPPAAKEQHDEMDEGMMDHATFAEGAAWCVRTEWTTIGRSGADELCLDARGPLRGGESAEDEELPGEAMTFTRVE